jgi:hypothetical protein
MSSSSSTSSSSVLSKHARCLLDHESDLETVVKKIKESSSSSSSSSKALPSVQALLQHPDLDGDLKMASEEWDVEFQKRVDDKSEFGDDDDDPPPPPPDETEEERRERIKENWGGYHVETKDGVAFKLWWKGVLEACHSFGSSLVVPTKLGDAVLLQESELPPILDADSPHEPDLFLKLDSTWTLRVRLWDHSFRPFHFVLYRFGDYRVEPPPPFPLIEGRAINPWGRPISLRDPAQLYFTRLWSWWSLAEDNVISLDTFDAIRNHHVQARRATLHQVLGCLSRVGPLPPHLSDIVADYDTPTCANDPLTRNLLFHD